MVNSWLLLSGIGMMLVGIIPVLWWWRTRKVSLKYFVFGAILWILAILPKVILDGTITPSLNQYLYGFGTVVFVITTGLYIGLRTGLFESGFTYLAALKTTLKQVTYKEAVAVGLGFGCFEAFALGVTSFINIVFFVLIPDLINQVPLEAQEAVLQQLNQSTLIVPAAVIERVFIIIVHVFTTLLVFYAIQQHQRKYLWYSIGFKTLVDGVLPALHVYIGMQTITGIYLIELCIIALGLFALVGNRWIQKLWKEKTHEKSNHNPK